MSYKCRKGIMCQDCLTAALPIVSPSLCLLSHFLANNGNGKLSCDEYFVHQQCYSAFVKMESSECESVDDTDAEQLATAHYTSAQQSGGGSTPATAKADRVAVELLWKKRHRAQETTEEHAAWQQSYMPYCARCSHQTCTTVAVSSLRNYSTCLRKVRTCIYIYIYISIYLYIFIYIIYLVNLA